MSVTIIFRAVVAADGIYISIGRYSDVQAVSGDVFYGNGADIDLSKLPAGTTHIRVQAVG